MIADPLRPEVAPIEFPPVQAQTHVLPNGLTLIVSEDRSAPVASVQAWVGTGSIHEDAWLGAGMSHLLEHMAFKGTARRSTNAIAQAVQDEGGYINAYTSFDRTVYWIDVPRAGVATAIDVLTDAALHSTLPAEEFTKEQEVIRREFAMVNDDPDRVNSHQLFATAYREHPYRHPVIGHLDVFNQVSREDVLAYYRTRYAPNNTTMVVVGDVDAAAVRAQLETLFTDVPRRPLPPVLIPAEPAQLGRREAHREFPTELSRTICAWHIPPITHPDVPALDVLATALGDGRSSRLYRAVRERLALAHGISAWSYVPAQPGLFGLDMTCDPDKRAAAQAAAFDVIDGIRQQGLPAPELEKSKKMLLAGQLGALVTMRGQASDLGSNWLLTGNLDFSRDYLAAVQRVTGEDLAHVARRYLRDANLTVCTLDPVGRPAKTVVTRPASVAGGIQRFTLPNGLRLLVREDPRLPLVSVDAVFRGGLLSETAADNGVSRLFARALLKGTTTRSAEEIAETIEGVGGSISSEAGSNSVTVSLEAMRPDLPRALDLLADVLRNPTFPETAIAREKEVQLAGQKAEEEHPTSVARNLLRANMFPGHPYGLRPLGSPGTLAVIDRAALVAYHRRALVGRDGVVAVFGDVKADEVRAAVERLLGDLPAGEVPAAPPVPAPLTGSADVEAIRDKEQAVLMVGFRGLAVDDPDRATLELIDEACSDLGSRFFIRIREELGLAYFVGSSHVPGVVPGMFTFYVGTDPAKVSLVREAFLGEIRQLAENGLTEEELVRARKKLIGKQAIAHQSNGALAFSVALDELYGLGYLFYRDATARLEAVTREDTRRVAQRFFAGQPSVITLVRPEQKEG